MLIGYARVSGPDQNLNLQLDALKAAGCERIFFDKMSGSRDDRPQLAKALAFCREGDTLVTWKLDRLGRSLRHLVNVVHGLMERKVGFKVLTGAAIDTSKAEGRLIFGIFASLAEFERSLIQERVIAGVRAAQERGVRFGRPKKLTDDVLAEVERRLPNESVAKIAADLGVGRSTLYANLGG